MSGIPSHLRFCWIGLALTIVAGACEPIATLPGAGPTDFPAVIPDTVSGPGVDTTASPEAGCEENGSACNDGDLCTVNDVCVAGSCQGSAIDCDDDITCTEDLCSEGVCQHTVSDGSCAIEGTCWSESQPNPSNPCLTCAPATAATAWSPHTAPCDDEDLCTTGDTCVEGACQGTALCPPSGDPCNVTLCDAGVCNSTPVDGALCDDGDPCTSDDTCDGGTCTAGVTLDADADNDPPISCGGSDCNDESSAMSGLLTEDCEDGIDNDCDDHTDGADSDCVASPIEGCTDPNASNYDPDATLDDGSCEPEPFPSCAYQKDCDGGAQVCGRWTATGETRCSPPCAGPADCEPGFVCSKLEGSAQIAYCHVPPAGTLAAGEACVSAETCASSICVDGICRDPCMNEDACGGGGNTCVMLGDLAAGWVMGICIPTPVGTQPIGAVCGAGSTWSSANCSTSHCDLLPYPAAAWYCAPLCRGVSDCLPGQECGLVIYADVVASEPVPMSAAVPYATRMGVTACYTAPATGPLGVGTACGAHGECASAFCATMGDPAINRCTSYCTSDDQCTGGAVPMGCRTSAIPLWSAWLSDPSISQPVSGDAYTLVRVCQTL